MDSEIQLKNVITSDSSQAKDDIESFGQSMSNAGQSASGFSENLATIADVAAGIALEKITEAAIQLGQALIDTGVQGSASLENVKVAFDSAFGNDASSQKMLTTLNKIATTMPVTNDQLDGMALRMQNMGVPTKQISGDLQDLADIASGTGMSFDQMGQVMEAASSTLSTAYQRGSVSSLQLRSIANQGIPIYQALVDTINASGKAADVMGVANAKAGAKSASAGLQHEALATKIKTASEALKILEAEHTKAGQATDKHNLAVEKAKDGLAQLQAQYTKTGDAMTTSGEKTKITVKDLLSGGKNIQISATLLQSAFQSLSEGKYAGAAQKQAESFNGVMKNLHQTFEETLMKMVGVSQDTGDITKGGIFDQLKGGLTALLAFFNQHSDDISAFFTNMVKAIGSVSTFFTTVLIPAFNIFIQSIGPVITVMVQQLTQVWNEHHDTIIKVAQFIGGALLLAFIGLVGTLSIFVIGLTQVIRWVAMLIEVFEQVPMQLNALGGLMKIWVAQVVSFFQTLPLSIYNIFNAVVNNILGLFNQLSARLTDWWNGLKSWLSGLGKQIGSYFKPVSDVLNGIHLGPGKQAGGFASGMTLVGESGPELVSLPSGSYVHGAGDTHQQMSSFSPTININNPTVRSDQDIETIISQVKQALGRQNELAKLGAL